MKSIEFVSKIWDRIEQWGIAVAGGYWKPVLRRHVAQGADERFEEMQTLLDGSGLEVQRSGTSETRDRDRTRMSQVRIRSSISWPIWSAS